MPEEWRRATHSIYILPVPSSTSLKTQRQATTAGQHMAALASAASP